MYFFFFFFQAEDGIRDAQESRGLGDVYKRQEYGTASDKQKLPAHMKEIQKAIEEKDSDLLRKRIGQMDSFYWSILLEQPGFWVGCFNYAKEDISSSRNKSESEEAIRQGERAIQNNDVPGLKAAVRKLWDLSPLTQEKTPGLGGGTIRV